MSPRTNRPPLAAAREHATKALIEKHRAEHEALAQEYLDRKGWVREEVTTHRWTTVSKGEEG